MNFLSLTNLEALHKESDLSEAGDIIINNFKYPVVQQNGQKGVGPVRNCYGLDKPCEYQNEIFLGNIDEDLDEETLLTYIMRSGEVLYFMRFLVNFSGKSRGIAFAQFLGKTPPIVIVDRLNKSFRQYNLKICAKISLNFRRLKMGNISSRIPPEQVLAILNHVQCLEYKLLFGERTATFVLVFSNNRHACLARRILLSNNLLLGRNLYVVWYDKPKKNF